MQPPPPCYPRCRCFIFSAEVRCRIIYGKQLLKTQKEFPGGYRVYIDLQADGPLCIFVGVSNMPAMSPATLCVLRSSPLALSHLGPVWTTDTRTVRLGMGGGGRHHRRLFRETSLPFFARGRQIAASWRRKSSPRGFFPSSSKVSNLSNSACAVLRLTSSWPTARTRPLSGRSTLSV